MSDYTGAGNTLPAAVGNGQISDLTAAQASTKFGAGNIRTPVANFTLIIGGHVMHGRRGVPILCDAAMLAALAGTPVV
jgi:hypothetical protein